MKKRILITISCLVFFISSSFADGKCSGKFFNPFTDVCWSCMFPIFVAPLPTKIGYSGQKGGIAPEKLSVQNSPSLLPTGACLCPGHLIPMGLLTSYQEPRRMVDVTKDPYCLVGLGGISLASGLDSIFPASGYGDETHGMQTRSSFYQMHWYAAPLLAILELFDDVGCTQGEVAEIDLAFMSEVDPAWNDDDVSFIFSPEEVLFSSLPAQLACTADCVGTSLPYSAPGEGIGDVKLKFDPGYLKLGTPSDDKASNPSSRSNPSRSLFWCAGCQGGLYPLNGNNIDSHYEVQTTLLTAEKANVLVHRMGLEMTTSGVSGMCSNVIPDMMIDKSEWKYQMTFPLPSPLNPVGSTSGACCNAFGETDSTWNSGASYPINGENFSYFWFHERDCCML